MKLRAVVLVAFTLAAAAVPDVHADVPAGQITWGVHTTLVPTYFDPAETIIGTSYMVLYGLHDAGGAFAYGSYPDIDGLFREQATMVDRARREALLHRLQQLVHDKAMFAPLYELAFVNGAGGRVEESGLGLIAGFAFPAPYEDVKLKSR